MTLKREIKDAYIENGASIYVKTHSNEVYIDDNETETLTQRIEDVTTQLDTMESEKATKLEVDVERKRIDTFTKLGEGSTTGDAELIDCRIGSDGVTYSNAGDSIRTQFNNTNVLISNITPDENLILKKNYNVLFKGMNKLFKRDFEASSTNNRYWDFAEYVGLVATNFGTDLKIQIVGNIKNVSGKLKSLTYQVNWFGADGTTKSANTSYADVAFGGTTIIKIPNAETKYAKITLYETLSEANGSKFTDEIMVNKLIIYTGEYEIDENVLPEFKNYRNVATDINKIKKDMSNLFEPNIIAPFTFKQGNMVGNNSDLSATKIRTEFNIIDFASARLICPEGYTAKCLRYDKNMQYLRHGNDASNVYEFIPKEDEFYYVVVVARVDGSAFGYKDFDGSSIKFERYSTNDINAKVNESYQFNTGKIYYDRLDKADSRYWLTKKNDSTGIYDFYCENRIRDILSADGVPMLFITDTHWRTTSKSKFSWDLCGLIANRIRCKNIVHGGDVLTQHGNGADAEVQLINELSPFIYMFGSDFKYALGNHDLNLANVGTGNFTNASETYKVSYETLYKRALIHLKDKVNFEVNSLNKNTEEYYREKFHYYYDDKENRLRFIVMDSGTKNDALSNGGTPERLQYQYDWLAETLTDTPVGYHILVIAHQFWSSNKSGTVATIESTVQGDNISKILNAYQNGTTITGSDTVVSFNYDFSNANRCPIIGMLSGHIHFDNLSVVNGITQIVTTTDAIDKTSHFNISMTQGTTTEHSFDILKIDKFTRTVKLFRIGAGSDREFNY